MNTLLLLVLGSIAAAAALAPVHNLEAPNAIPNKYLVILSENTTEVLRDGHTSRLGSRLAARGLGEQVLSSFKIGSLIGYAVYYNKDMLDEERANPMVKYIENDQVVTIYDEEPEDELDETITQSPATWGIDRVDQRDLPLSNSYTYWASAGSGVDCYIIDTGIYVQHNDFEARARWGFNAILNEGFTDGNGHGTHVASTTGGLVYGVAKKCTLIAVKVLSAGGSGSWEGVIQGIQYVTNDHNNKGKGKSVANMSLGGGVSPTVDNAVTQSILAGVNYAIAAGNNNGDACNFSPARTPGCLSTAASTNTDARASFSNFGSCTVIFAPGNLITAAWIGAVDRINTISGTSMAAPHVCGAVAQYLGHLDANVPIPTPVEVGNALIKASTPSKITNPGNLSPNRLLYVEYSDI